MPKIKVNNTETESVEKEEIKVEDFEVEPSKKEPKKKAYIVVLTNPNTVVCRRTTSTTNTHTYNIWGNKLVPGDTIYLDK